MNFNGWKFSVPYYSCKVFWKKYQSSASNMSSFGMDPTSYSSSLAPEKCLDEKNIFRWSVKSSSKIYEPYLCSKILLLSFFLFIYPCSFYVTRRICNRDIESTGGTFLRQEKMCSDFNGEQHWLTLDWLTLPFSLEIFLFRKMFFDSVRIRTCNLKIKNTA